MLKIEKFPDLVYQGRRLVWDSRQVPDGRPELVFLPHPARAPEEVRSALRARANAVVAAPELKLGEVASEALEFPSQKLRVIAITGTNGKTTSMQILRRTLVASGRATAEIGTVGVSLFRANENEPFAHVETGFTTPEAPQLHHIFAQLVELGVDHVVMEASSHAMELGRIEGVDFDGAVFTNLTPDHLDIHGTMEAYEEAKTRLFTEYLPRVASAKRKFAAIHVGDPAGKRILARLVGLPLLAEGFARGETFEEKQSSLSGTRIRFLPEGATLPTALVGAYNVENVVGAVTAVRLFARALGRLPKYFEPAIQEALRDFHGPPGRMERVPSKDGRHVFVDYAHTPDALERVLRVLRESKNPDAQLVVVFGCGGDRDRLKRPQMGRIASELADEVILTSDNPRTEDPRAILDEILAGVSGTGVARVSVEVDRRQAIERALKNLFRDDVALIAGKGHEAFQIVGHAKIPFSDVGICREILERK